MVFARVYCRLKQGDAAALEMSKANTGNRRKDALAWLLNSSARRGWTMKVLDHRRCAISSCFSSDSGCGRARENIARVATGQRATRVPSRRRRECSSPASTRRVRNPLLGQLFDQYLSKPSGFVEIFQEGVRCRASDLQNFGSGKGREFQRLSKECPAFAVEFAALGLRLFRTHWGPINRREVEIRPECNVMLLEVQNFVDSEQVCPLLI